MKAHFFDIDTVLDINNKVWIVDKNNPNIPILKISKSDFNLIKSGLYRSQNNRLDFNGNIFWLPKNMIDNIKVKCKNHNVDISDLAVSMQEFMNKELIENLEFKLIYDNIQHLKNTNDHIYIICSRNSKRNYEFIIKKLEELLKQNGLLVTNFYYISETFYNRDSDEVAYKKARLILQHILGFKTDGDKFTDEEITKYSEINYYDDEDKSIQLLSEANYLIKKFLGDTDEVISGRIKDILNKYSNTLFINTVSVNKRNRFSTKKVILEYNNLIRTFESFKYLR
jgi:hypothetical protein